MTVKYLIQEREYGYSGCYGEQKEPYKFTCKVPFPEASEGILFDSIEPRIVYLMGTYLEYGPAREEYLRYIQKMKSCIGKEFTMNEEYISTSPRILTTTFYEKPETAPAIKISVVKNSGVTKKPSYIYYDLHISFESPVSPPDAKPASISKTTE